MHIRHIKLYKLFEKNHTWLHTAMLYTACVMNEIDYQNNVDDKRSKPTLFIAHLELVMPGK